MASKKERWVIVRTYSAGVFFGRLASRTGQEVVLHEARRLWYWAGAATLSELAMHGTRKPEACKFPCPVGRIELLQAIEVIDCTAAAITSIQEVPVWTAQ